MASSGIPPPFFGKKHMEKMRFLEKNSNQKKDKHRDEDPGFSCFGKSFFGKKERKSNRVSPGCGYGYGEIVDTTLLKSCQTLSKSRRKKMKNKTLNYYLSDDEETTDVPTDISTDPSTIATANAPNVDETGRFSYLNGKKQIHKGQIRPGCGEIDTSILKNKTLIYCLSDDEETTDAPTDIHTDISTVPPTIAPADGLNVDETEIFSHLNGKKEMNKAEDECCHFVLVESEAIEPDENNDYQKTEEKDKDENIDKEKYPLPLPPLPPSPIIEDIGAFKEAWKRAEDEEKRKSLEKEEEEDEDHRYFLEEIMEIEQRKVDQLRKIASSYFPQQEYHPCHRTDYYDSHAETVERENEYCGLRPATVESDNECYGLRAATVESDNDSGIYV